MKFTSKSIDNSAMSDSNWWGNSFEEILNGTSLWRFKIVPDVIPSENHKVLVQLPLHPSTIPPKPHKGYHKWDSEHVRLPFSPKNQYPVINEDGTDDIKERWGLIKKAFAKPILSSRELEQAILSYNTKYSKCWKFKALHKLFEDELDEEIAESFFKNTLPQIIDLALRLPDVITCAIPLLKQGQNKSITFSQEQIASLLANAFLCTFPRRNTQKSNSEYKSFPEINFNRLYQSTEPQVLEKISCICNYFRRVCQKVPSGVVTIIRRSFHEKLFPEWDHIDLDFCSTKLHITSHGTIEDEGAGMLQVDFANRFLGGGVLGRGCVQEEIRFVVCPEMLICKLVTEALLPNEAVFLIGCERYSKYSGYASTFKYNGNYLDDTPIDEWLRKRCCVVAIDALHFYKPQDQFREDRMERELKKAFVGYKPFHDAPSAPVATGNWGCGAFGGNKRLKALLQLMVCCVVSRPLVYYAFGDEELCIDFTQMFDFLKKEMITIDKLWRFLKNFNKQNLPPEHLYPFIYQSFLDSKRNLKIETSTSERTSPKRTRFLIQPTSFYGDNKIDDDQKMLDQKSFLNSNPSSSLLGSLDESYYNKESTSLSCRSYCPNQPVESCSSLLNELDKSYNKSDQPQKYELEIVDKNESQDHSINKFDKEIGESSTTDATKTIDAVKMENSEVYETQNDIEIVDSIAPKSIKLNSVIGKPRTTQKKLSDFFR